MRRDMHQNRSVNNPSEKGHARDGGIRYPRLAPVEHEPTVDLFRDGVHPRGIRAVVRLRQALQRARSLSARCRRPGSRDGPTKQPTSSPFAVRGDTTADQ